MFKKFLLSIVSAFFIFSCSNAVNDSDAVLQSENGISASTVSSMVKLVKAESFVHSKYGISSYSKNYVILVKDAAYSKLVSVHMKGTEPGSWSDIPASYVSEAADGYEVWSLSFSPPQPSLWDKQFCIRYQVNGQEYWDNNNGSDYYLDWNDGVILGSTTQVKQFGSYTQTYSGKKFEVNVDVRNLAYNKAVNIVYSTDNWATTRVAQAVYQNGYYYGYSGYHTSPNQYGVERWLASVSVPDDAITVKYAVSYDVNGTTYWDNNNGSNYSVTFF